MAQVRRKSSGQRRGQASAGRSGAATLPARASERGTDSARHDPLRHADPGPGPRQGTPGRKVDPISGQPPAQRPRRSLLINRSSPLLLSKLSYQFDFFFLSFFFPLPLPSFSPMNIHERLSDSARITQTCELVSYDYHFRSAFSFIPPLLPSPSASA